MKLPLNTKQAWRYMARLWDKTNTIQNGKTCVSVINPNNPEQFVKTFGLCYTLIYMKYYGIITKNTYAKMQQVLFTHRHRENLPSGYYWPHTPEGAKQRAAFCRQQANTPKKTKTNI